MKCMYIYKNYLKSRGWLNIKKIIGIGFNYDNPYRDIVTTIEDFDLTDVDVDPAIVDIWNEVGK